jgi:predicted DNA-binding ribbon-helix-helix protein
MSAQDTAAKGQKRSLSIAGHRTSVSLEEPFWTGLKVIAATEQCALADLIARIDAGRGENNLSSALRLRVLAHFQALAETARTPS